MSSFLQVTISNSSSRVPKPPGSATKASASSAMSALRACMSGTTRRSRSVRCAISRSTRPRGMTPVTVPPRATTSSASAPMRPTLAPPYTRWSRRSASSRPRARAAARWRGSRPGLEPQKTQTRVTSPASSPLREHRHEQPEAGDSRAGVARDVPLARGVLHALADRLARGHRVVLVHLRTAVDEAEDAEEHHDAAEVAHAWTPYSPLNEGFLFSRNAVVPSVLSADSNVMAWAVDS